SQAPPTAGQESPYALRLPGQHLSQPLRRALRAAQTGRSRVDLDRDRLLRELSGPPPSVTRGGATGRPRVRRSARGPSLDRAGSGHHQLAGRHPLHGSRQCRGPPARVPRNRAEDLLPRRLRPDHSPAVHRRSLEQAGRGVSEGIRGDRFEHRRARFGDPGKSMTKTAFLITIDTEGDDIWGHPDRITTENSRFLPRFQRLCQEHGFKPTYLVNYEMAIDPRFQEFGRSV